MANGRCRMHDGKSTGVPPAKEQQEQHEHGLFATGNIKHRFHRTIRNSMDEYKSEVCFNHSSRLCLLILKVTQLKS